MRDEDLAYAVSFHLREILAACDGGVAAVIRRKVDAALQDFAKLRAARRGAESLKRQMECLLPIRGQGRKQADPLRLALRHLESRIASIAR